jgi:CRISPR/Cas system-associated exonuclease Cas4 (RecB family)
MYLLTRQEQELAMRIANNLEITETHRGYELIRTSPESMPMDFSEVTNTFCPTQRRLYVSKILGIPSKTSKSMAMGSIEHASIALVFNKVRIARSDGRKISEVADELESIAFDDDSIIAALWSDNDLESIEKYCVDGGFSYQGALPEFVDVAKQFIRIEANRLRGLGPLVDAFPDIIAIEEFVDGTSLGMNKGSWCKTLMTRTLSS